MGYYEKIKAEVYKGTVEGYVVVGTHHELMDVCMDGWMDGWMDGEKVG